jgi:3-oxoadipate enol-lactonase
MPTTQVRNTALYYQVDDFTDPWVPSETVFMQHGFSRNGNLLKAWVPTLGRHFKVIRMDLRGCGQSEDPGPEYQYSMGEIVQDFVSFLDTLNVPKVHYIGEAFGGAIGAEAAAAHPERFASLTLIATPVRTDATGHGVLNLGFATWADAIRELGMGEWWLRSREVGGELDGSGRDEYFASEVIRTPAHVAIALLGVIPTFDIERLFPKLTMPLLVLAPGSGRALPVEHQRLFQSIPGVTWKSYEEGTGLMACIMPDTLAAETLQFLLGLRKKSLSPV